MGDGKLQTIYGLSRLAFGAGLLAAPAQIGGGLIGADAQQPSPRALLRFYGTRDTLLGLGALQASMRGEGVTPWIAAGIGADVLDVAVQVLEREAIPEPQRAPGLLLAAGAALAGAVVLARVY